MEQLKDLRENLRAIEILKIEEQAKIMGGKSDDDKRRRRPGTTKIKTDKS